MSNSYYFFFST